MFQELITAELKLLAAAKQEFMEKTAGEAYECLYPADYQVK